MNKNYILENFANYDLSLKMRTAGFDIPTFGNYLLQSSNDTDNDILLNLSGMCFSYSQNKFFHGMPINYNTDIIFKEGRISAPLIQQIIDWFREKHNIWIETKIADAEDMSIIYGYLLLNTKKEIDFISRKEGFASKLEANIEAIEKALTLIKEI